MAVDTRGKRFSMMNFGSPQFNHVLVANVGNSAEDWGDFGSEEAEDWLDDSTNTRGSQDWANFAGQAEVNPHQSLLNLYSGITLDPPAGGPTFQAAWVARSNIIIQGSAPL